MLNLRLNKFLDHHNILEENQAGFRSGYSTSDHIFVLHALIEILKSKKKKIFVHLLTLVRLLILFGELACGLNF